MVAGALELIQATHLPLYSRFVQSTCLKCVHVKVKDIPASETLSSRVQTIVEPCAEHIRGYGESLRDFVEADDSVIPLLDYELLARLF